MKQHIAETIRELMARYDEYREKWIAEHGSENGFHEWFTVQVARPINENAGN